MSVSALIAFGIADQIHHFKNGEILDAKNLNDGFTALRTAIEDLPDCSKHQVKLYIAGSPQVISESVPTPIRFDGESFDSQDMHDLASQSSRVVISKTGNYILTGIINYSNHSPYNITDGFRQLQISHNGKLLEYPVLNYPHGGVISINHTTVARLEEGDYVELRTYQYTDGVGGEQSIFSAYFSVLRLCGD